MQRKYIYIIVIWLTILLVATQEFLNMDSSKNAAADSVMYTDENYDESFNTATIYSPLEIKNLQNDDKSLLYTYKIKIEGISGAYRYEKNEKEGYMVFSANGEAQFILSSNDTYTIYDLPNEAVYSIEQTNIVSNEYTTTTNDENTTTATGIISLDNKVVFDNKTIIKEIEEEPEEEKKNPITSDYIVLVTLLFILGLISLIIISSIKIKRFE